MKIRKGFVITSALILIFAAFLVVSCASKKTPTSTETEPTNTPAVVNTNTPTPTNTTASGATATPTNTTASGATATPTNTQVPALYNFDSTWQGWTVSNYSSPPNDGELGITNAVVSNSQVYAGAGAAELTCNFTGDLGNTTTAKGAFKIGLTTPENLTGKTITVHVYVPTNITQPPYSSTPYGAKVYIKTGTNFTWADGGWNNLLTPGWNTFTFSPSGVGEADTREVGVQISKGTGTPDWQGTIYVDEVNW